MSETIWLISILIDEYSGAEPLVARRSLESAKRRCDENRKLNKSDDYSIGPITWVTSAEQVTGTAVVTYISKGETRTISQIYLIDEMKLED